ncbi:MAG: hypothetical protein MI861_19290 [Pirellulales bacterium]|nr:hypothetical protein [Pirellulales bacterium]
MRQVIASAQIANLDRKVLEPQKHVLGTTLPVRERRALCCSVVGFREPVPSGLGFDAPFLLALKPRLLNPLSNATTGNYAMSEPTQETAESRSVEPALSNFSPSATNTPVPKWAIGVGVGCLGVMGMCVLLAAFGAFLQLVGYHPTPNVSDYPPLKLAIDEGKEVWEVELDQEDDIFHYYILDDDEVVEHYFALLSSKSREWTWNDARGGTAVQEFSGRRSADGSITITHVKHIRNPAGKVIVNSTSKSVISGNVFSGEHHVDSTTGTSSTRRKQTGTAKRIQ